MLFDWSNFTRVQKVITSIAGFSALVLISSLVLWGGQGFMVSLFVLSIIGIIASALSLIE